MVADIQIFKCRPLVAMHITGKFTVFALVLLENHYKRSRFGLVFLQYVMHFCRSFQFNYATYCKFYSFSSSSIVRTAKSLVFSISKTVHTANSLCGLQSSQPLNCVVEFTRFNFLVLYFSITSFQSYQKFAFYGSNMGLGILGFRPQFGRNLI